MITARVEGLQKSVRRIKDKLRAPYEHIAQKTRRLERMQTACELLRRTVRFLTLVSKLRQQRSGGDKDMSRVRRGRRRKTSGRCDVAIRRRRNAGAPLRPLTHSLTRP